MFLTNSTTTLLLSAITAISMVMVYRLPYFQRNHSFSLVLVLNWLFLLLSVAETRTGQCFGAVQHTLQAMYRTVQRAEQNTLRGVFAYATTLLHPVDTLVHMYRAPLTMVRASSDATRKIDDWLTQFANPGLVQAFRSFSMGITVLCYAVVFGLVGLGAGAALVCFKVAVRAGQLLHWHWARWLEVPAIHAHADADR